MPICSYKIGYSVILHPRTNQKCPFRQQKNRTVRTVFLVRDNGLERCSIARSEARRNPLHVGMITYKIFRHRRKSVRSLPEGGVTNKQPFVLRTRLFYAKMSPCASTDRFFGIKKSNLRLPGCLGWCPTVESVQMY